MSDENKSNEIPAEENTRDQPSVEEILGEASDSQTPEASSELDMPDNFDMSQPDTEPDKPVALVGDKDEALATIDPDTSDDLEMLFDDTEPVVPVDAKLSDLNLSSEDSTQDVEIIFEHDLSTEDSPATYVFTAEGDDEDDSEAAEELNIVAEDETTPVSVLREEDLALLENIQGNADDPDDTSENTSDGEEEIVIRDFLNEDDGEPLGTPEYLKSPEPEWKMVARQLREDREAKRRELIERRKQEDERVIAERKEHMDQREKQREDQESEFREDWERRQQEKKQAVNDMMQRIREDRERKEQERAATDPRLSRQKTTYPKPPERKPYPKPSEIKRMEREQPLKDSDSDIFETTKMTPIKKTKPGDMESRLNRLSKPDEPADESSNPPADTPEDAPSDNPESE